MSEESFGKRSGPVRMCVICRRRFDVADLARHVMDQEGMLSLDAQRKMPGRGWYCCKNAQCVARFPMFRQGKIRHARRLATRGDV